MDNEKFIWDKLIAAGLTPCGAAASMGNHKAESGLNSKNLQNSYENNPAKTGGIGYTDATYTAAVDSGAYTGFANDGAGYGLCQWTYPTRKAALLAFVRAAGVSIGDTGAQVDFYIKELKESFPKVWKVLTTAKTVREASDVVLLQFERPASVADPVKRQETSDRRAALGQEFYDKFMGGETMGFIMTASELCAKARGIARDYKTSYMLGPWGWPANDKMIIRATTNGSNAQANKGWLSYANAIKGKGFLFDCVGLIKGILWGWNGDLSKTYGGAGYACNGVPDIGADTMIARCHDVSTDFSAIVPGEAVWMTGHIGIYVGGGVVVESTPKWNWGVQESTCLNVAGKQLPDTVGSRTWTKHGKLPWVDYSAADKPADDEKEDEEMVKYKNLEDVPAWYKDAVKKVVDKGALNGTGNGELNVSEDLCRTLTILDRLGKLD